jgi:hypothetical protein
VATIAIKGKTSSSKSIFPKLSKHTCLMAKEGRKKGKSKTSSSPKYVTSDNYQSSDDDSPFPSEIVKNPNAMIKGLMRQVGARDELPEQQELLVQERKFSKELKKLHLKKLRGRSLTKNLLKAKRLLVVSRAQLVRFKVNMMSY